MSSVDVVTKCSGNSDLLSKSPFEVWGEIFPTGLSGANLADNLVCQPKTAIAQEIDAWVFILLHKKYCCNGCIQRGK